MNSKKVFLPLLFFYLIIVLFVASNNKYINFANKQSFGFVNEWGRSVTIDEFVYDEARYVKYATNLSNGYYSPRDDIDIWAGPGYPIILVPFVLLKLPWLAAKLMNALLLSMAILYFFNTLRFYVKERMALLLSYVLGLAPPIMRYLPHLMTEVFTIFLVCAFTYHFCNYHNTGYKSRIQLLLSSLYLGYLALTKVIFGYTILVVLIVLCIFFLIKRKNYVKKSLIIYLLALFFCMPYLFYTYSLTGKIFYWANSGGASLYWMSSPYSDELGDWRSTKEVFENPLLEKHLEFYRELSKLSSIQKDDALKKKAINNIISNPSKYLRNWVANVGRLLIYYPYTERPPRTKIYYLASMIPNMFIVVFSFICIYPSYIGRRIIPHEIFAILLFALIAFVCSSMVSAYGRQFQPLIPLFALWIIFTLCNVLKIEVRQ